MSVSVTAQSILHKGQKYEVQNEIILINGEDVTQTLSKQERKAIYIKYNREAESLKKRVNQNIQLDKAKKKEEKKLKKSEKQQKKAEKKQKKAEKEVKLKEKAKKNFEKAERIYEKSQKKFNKLKSKGKLSTEDETKWLKKLEKQKEQIAKAKKKLKKS